MEQFGTGNYEFCKKYASMGKITKKERKIGSEVHEKWAWFGVSWVFGGGAYCLRAQDGASSVDSVTFEVTEVYGASGSVFEFLSSDG